MRAWRYRWPPASLRTVPARSAAARRNRRHVHAGDRGSTLVEYKERIVEGQKQIYYISGASKAAAAASPVLERLKAKGYEALPPSPEPPASEPSLPRPSPLLPNAPTYSVPHYSRPVQCEALPRMAPGPYL